MNSALVQRQLALAGVAVLASLATAAFGRGESAGGGPAQEDVLPAAAGTWYVATVGSYGRGFFGRTTACGVRLTPETRGISHPILPCRAKIVIAYEGREMRVEVVDRAAYAAGHEFELTEALARDLGVRGEKMLRWRFAGT